MEAVADGRDPEEQRARCDGPEAGESQHRQHLAHAWSRRRRGRRFRSGRFHEEKDDANAEQRNREADDEEDIERAAHPRQQQERHNRPDEGADRVQRAVRHQTRSRDRPTGCATRSTRPAVRSAALCRFGQSRRRRQSSSTMRPRRGSAIGTQPKSRSQPPRAPCTGASDRRAGLRRCAPAQPCPDTGRRSRRRRPG